jgi:hypothetical protein
LVTAHAMRASLQPPAATWRAPAAPRAARRCLPRAAPRAAAASTTAAAAASPPPRAAQQQQQPWSASAAAAATALDDRLSSRPLSLDAAGYFLIAADHANSVIIARHYGNTINAAGLACDPRTGDVIPCSGYMPPPPREFVGATAKAVAVEILESPAGAGCVTRLEHAAYLGRELQKAEEALRSGGAYMQD